MRLRLSRRWFTERSTIGQLYVDDVEECFTLEDMVRRDPDPATSANEAKVPGRTAIPAGRYCVVITPSRRFKADLPELLDVPGFTAIRIHAGNTDADTEGCILVGRIREPDRISASRSALEALVPKLLDGLAAGEIWIDVEQVGVPEELLA